MEFPDEKSRNSLAAGGGVTGEVSTWRAAIRKLEKFLGRLQHPQARQPGTSDPLDHSPRIALLSDRLSRFTFISWHKNQC